MSLLGGAAASVAAPPAVRAQQPALPVLGFLSSLSPQALAKPLLAFRQGLSETGHDDGRNIAIEYRWADGQYARLPELASQLVRLNPSVIVTVGGDFAALAAKAATPTIPIVFMVGNDPVKTGLVRSFNRPEGNATGMHLFITNLEAKRVGLLHQLVAPAATLAMFINPKLETAEAQASDIIAAAQALGRKFEIVNCSDEMEIQRGFENSKRKNVGAILISADPFFISRTSLIVLLAAQHTIPVMYPTRECVDAGGLMSYGTSFPDAYRQVGIYAGRILNREPPASLPILQPTEFEFVINLKTAKALGVTIPPTLLALADEVIE